MNPPNPSGTVGQLPLNQQKGIVMNKLVPGALFSKRAAEEQRLRMHKHVDAVPRPEGVTDVRSVEASWSRAARGFRKNDPDGRKLARLFEEAD